MDAIGRNDIEYFVKSLNGVPSLEQIIEVRLLIGLWYNEISQMKDTNLIFTNHVKTSIRCSIIELPFEPVILEKLLFYADVIGNSIQEWMDHMRADCAFTSEVYFSALRQVHLIVWTPRGTVNYLKSAISVLEYGDVDVHVKFLIAGNYCLLEYVTMYYPLINYKKIKQNMLCHPVVRYWWMYASGVVELNAHTFYERAVIKIQEQQRGSSEALKIFWQRLSAEQRKNCIAYWLNIFRNDTFVDFEPIKVLLRVIQQDESIRYSDVEMSRKILELLTGIVEQKVWSCDLTELLIILTRIPEQHLSFCRTNYTILVNTVIQSMRNEYLYGRWLTGGKCLQILKTLWNYLAYNCQKFLLTCRNLTYSLLFFPWIDECDFVLSTLAKADLEMRKSMLFYSPYTCQLAECVRLEDWDKYVAMINTSLSYEDSRILKKKILLRMIPLDLNWNGATFLINRCLGLTNCYSFKVLLAKVLDLCNERDDVKVIVARLFYFRVEELRQRRYDIQMKIYQYMQHCRIEIQCRFNKNRMRGFFAQLTKIYCERNDKILLQFIDGFKLDNRIK